MSAMNFDLQLGRACFDNGIDYIACGATPHEAKRVYVLLHGIGSGATSWHNQLNAIQHQTETCALAWNAPGYARSTPLIDARPTSTDYAAALWQWLENLNIKEPVVLVGHSLGALIAASAAASKPTAIDRLVLLAPALGYGDESVEAQEKIVNQRMSNLTHLGAKAMAAARAPAMLSPNADKAHIQFVEKIMGQLNPVGYAQAVHMLSTGRLIADLQSITASVSKKFTIDVASGSADSITPPTKCALAAKAANTELIDLGPVGHVCALEGYVAVNQLLAI
jgi:pimeloyl-ACP methyl ester carboxylesterase